MRWPLKLPERRAGRADMLAIGENSLDFVGVGPSVRGFPDKASLSSFSQMVGGQAATAAVACARQGFRARYLGAFGDDGFGREVRLTLEGAGVEVIAVERTGVPSRTALILVDEATGDRSVLERLDPALRLDANGVDRAAVEQARTLLVDATHPDASIAALRLARAGGIPTIVDVDRAVPQAEAILALADVAIVPRGFLARWGREPGAALASLAAEFRPAVAIATLGAEGALARIGTHEVLVPGYRVPVVDTTGAGDAFRGGLVSGWLALGHDPRAADILRWANATAALNCRAIGAQTALPTRDEVDALVTRGADDRSN